MTADPAAPDADSLSGNEVELISDGDGLVVIGESAAVDRFLAAEGLSSRDVGLPRLQTLLRAGGGAAQVGSNIAANSGRWVKLTKESAAAIKKYGLTESSKTKSLSSALRNEKGQIKGFVEFAKGPGSALKNPAALANVGVLMAQLAMQQAMDEITDYLVIIDAKVDDVLRAQKDTVISRMIGVGLVVDETMHIREATGRVDEITWSKVQAAPAAIAETQAYALLQLDGLVEKVSGKTDVGDLAAAARDAESTAQEWLAVLARCSQLHDAVGVLELDRVLDASPDEVDGHRAGLKAARQERLANISQTAGRLMTSLDHAVGTANAKVLLHPSSAGDVQRASRQVGDAVGAFQEVLGTAGDRQLVEARKWSQAAGDVRDRAFETGSGGVSAALRVSDQTFGRAKSATGKVSSSITRRVPRRGGRKTKDDPEG